uniref:ML domain-containing protein n=1 Tax=Strongyloides venezuelensis TaxID=75913 RepID=A0A0K0FF93_STRVS
MEYSKLSFFVILLIAYSSFTEGCTDFPNGTDTKLHWFYTDDLSLNVTNLKLSAVDGSSNYPLDFSKSYKIDITIENFGKEATELELDTYISQWTSQSDCMWLLLPTYNIIKTNNLCGNGTTCPLKVGSQKVSLSIDLAKYSTVMSLLKPDAAYKFMFYIYSTKTTHFIDLVLQLRGGKP